MVTSSDDVAGRFEKLSSRLHLTRNNVFGIAAFEAAYGGGAGWLDDLLGLIKDNVTILERNLPGRIDVIAPEGTYLAWLDLRRLELDVPVIPAWLAAEAGLALSPGHWFGREGAGFARLTVAAPTDTIKRAAEQLASSVGRLT